MRKIFGLLLATAPLFSLAQDLQTVTQNGNTTTLGINVGGNVGIGTTIPTQKLTLNGNLGFSGDNVNRYIITDATYTGTGRVTIQAGAGSDGFGGALNLYGHAHNSKPGWVVVGLSASAGVAGTGNEGRFTVNDVGLGGGVDLFTVLGSGNVGIGTTTPNEKLTVSGKMLSDGLKLDENNVRLWSLIPNGGNLSVTSGDGNGNISIGSTGAPEKLSVNGRILSEGIKLNENGIRLWSLVPLNGNLSFSSGDDNGFVGIGTNMPKEKLSVNGKIRAKEIKVESANWPDYVFEEGYKVGTLEALEGYIKANKRLPEMPSAKEVETNGVELGEMNKLLLKKVEELTLLLIEQNKKNEKQEQAIDELRKELEKVKSKQ